MDGQAQVSIPLHQALEQSGAFHRVLFHQSRDPIMILDQEGVIRDCNDAAIDVLGRYREQLVGLSPDIISPRVQPGGGPSNEKSAELIETAFREGEQEFEWEHLHTDGRSLYFIVSLHPIELNDTTYLLCVMRDITEQKRTDIINQMLINIAIATSTAGDLEELLSVIHAELSHLLDTKNFYVALYHEEERGYTFPYLVDEHDDTGEDGEVLPLEGSLTDYVRRTGKSICATPEIFNSLVEEGEVVLFGADSEVWLGAPLRTPHGDIGVVALQSYTNPRLYTDADVEILEFVSDHIALAIERKQTEEMLRASENRYRTLFHDSPAAVCLFDTDLKLVQFNQRMVDLFQSTREELLDLPLGELSNKRIVKCFESALKGKNCDYEGPYALHEDEVEIHISVNFAPLTDAEGNIIGGIAVGLDMTDRIRAEKELEVLTVYQQELFDGAPEAIALLSNDDSVLSINRYFTTLFGYTPEEAVGQMINDLIVPSEMMDEGLELTHKVAIGDPINVETWRQTKDGKRVEVSILGNPIVLGGQQLAVYGIYRDISERKRAEEALRRREEQLRNVVDSVYAALWSAEIDKETSVYHYTFFSENIDRITGYKPEEFIRDGASLWNNLLHPNDIGLARKFDQKLLAGESATCTYRVFQKNGIVRWLYDVATPAEHQVEGKACVNGVTFDITERKEAEELLAEEKERLAVTLSSIGDAVISTDIEGRVVLMNKHASELTGWEREDAIGKLISDVFNLVDEKTERRAPNPVAEVLVQGGAIATEYEGMLIAQNGVKRIISDSAAPIRDSRSEIIGVVLVFRDITEQRKLEQEVLKAQKLESLGLLAGGIAHDFNNILAAVLGNISIAQVLAKEKKLHERLEVAESAALRAKDLTQQLLTFSKGGAPIKKTIAIEEIIRETTEFALRGSRVRSILNLPDDLQPVEVDPGQISQVINNMVINAMQAMPDGGLIRLTAANVALNEDSILPVQTGNYIRIDISDQGVGIPRGNLDKIFDPYYTTKRSGSGLGLASCFSIIAKHNGHITVESQINQGTTFSIYLPASGKIIEAQVTENVISHQGQGKILVMDDEVAVREVAREMLEHMGYAVDEAENGHQALELYQQAREEGDPYKMVIMDLTIPGGMGGQETVVKLLELDPKVTAIVSSGYSTDPVMADYTRYGFKGVVAKPYRVRDLSDALESIEQMKQG